MFCEDLDFSLLVKLTEAIGTNSCNHSATNWLTRVMERVTRKVEAGERFRKCIRKPTENRLTESSRALMLWQAARRDRQAKIDSGRSSTNLQQILKHRLSASSLQYLAVSSGCLERSQTFYGSMLSGDDTAKLHVEHTTMPPPPPQMGGRSMA